VAEAFKDFWRKEPKIKRLEFVFVKEPSTRYAMVKKGEIDIATLMTDVFYKRVKEDPSLRVGEPPSPTSFTVYMGAQWDPKSPWSDPRVRKAASLALDRKLIADIHNPGASPMGNFGLQGDPDNIAFPADPYDPEGAKKLLAEAGYPKGFHGGKYFPFDGPYWPMGEQVANYWKAIGITVDTTLYDRPTWFSKRKAGEFKGGVWTDPIAPIPVGLKLAYVFGAGAYGKYDDIQAVWNKYLESVDPKERKDLITRVQNMYHDRTMFVHLIGASSPAAVGPRVKGDPWKIKPIIWWVCPMEDLELNSYD
jgi:peptide/nickel transport system substrate-binding protein